MNQKSGSGKLSVMMLILGLAALVLRRMLYAAAVDVKGLLVRNHPLEIGLLVLTAAALIMVVVISRNIKGSGVYEEYRFSGISGLVGNVAAGAGILVTVLTSDFIPGSSLVSAWHWLGLAAPVCLLLAGFTRMLGKKPFFLLHVVVCLFLVLHIVTRYQLWSGHPQMQDYLFSLLGAMALMFFGFYTAALEADCGNLPVMVGMGLAAVYLCFAELARSSCPGLYLGGIVWVLSDLWGMRKIENR